MTEMIKFVVAKIAASVWSIEQASSIQAISPFSCSFPFSLSRHPLETKGAERGWVAKKNTCPPAGNRCHCIETGKRTTPSSSGWVVDEPLKVELLAMLWPCVRSAGRVSPCAPAGHALATLGREPAPRRDTHIPAIIQWIHEYEYLTGRTVAAAPGRMHNAPHSRTIRVTRG